MQLLLNEEDFLWNEHTHDFGAYKNHFAKQTVFTGMKL